MRKRLHFTPRRFVRDQDIHVVDGCLLTGRQLVLRRQQSIDALLVATGGAQQLAAAIEQLFQQQTQSLFPLTPPLPVMYNFEQEKPKLATPKGQQCFAILHQVAAHCISTAGAFTMQTMLDTASDVDQWLVMACIDEMVARRHVREVIQATPPVGQRRVFVKF